MSNDTSVIGAHHFDPQQKRNPDKARRDIRQHIGSNSCANVLEEDCLVHCELVIQKALCHRRRWQWERRLLLLASSGRIFLPLSLGFHHMLTRRTLHPACSTTLNGCAPGGLCRVFASALLGEVTDGNGVLAKSLALIHASECTKSSTQPWP